MLNNFAFTLYEVFGYLLPGGVVLAALVTLYWAVFAPQMPLSLVDLQAGMVTWVAVIFASYLLGHAAQALGNIWLHGIEDSVLNPRNGSAPAWMRERARQAASETLTVNPEKLEPLWVFRALDECAIQRGKDGDRDIFVYREGFYRGTAISLFLLTAALLLRLVLPGASIQFTKGLFHVSRWATLTTSVMSCGIAYLFLRRYQRFAEYRVTRAVLAALVLQRARGNSESAEAMPTPTPREG